MPNKETDDNSGSPDMAEAIDEYSFACRRIKAFQRFAFFILFVIGLLIFGEILFELVTGNRVPDNYRNIVTPFMVVPGLSLPLFIGMVPALKRKQRAILKLSNSQDVSALGPLVERIGSGEIYRRDDFAIAIMNLLPKLTESSSEILEPRHWKLLCKTLDPNLLITFSASEVNVDYFGVVLETIAEIGGQPTLDTVERLARLTPKNAGQVRVKQQAVESLFKMRERFARQTAGDDLLRAVDGSGDALLRPVQTSDSGNDGNELLRPISHSSNPQ